MTWLPNIRTVEGPRYLAIADAIESDVEGGRLAAGHRLPTQRALARRLNVDFTTVARGYVEAQRRGLIESHVGRGTFVSEGRAPPPVIGPAHPERVDRTMNLPPEPTDPELIGRMQAGLREVASDLVSLLRYQPFGGSDQDKEAATSWLGRRALVPKHDRLFVSPGAHPALLAIFGALARPGDVILSEAVTYPGARAFAAQLGLNLVGLPMDEDGIDPDALARICAALAPKLLYINPTLQNPTTLTVPAKRRAAIAQVARKFGLPIVEDDAYGFIPLHGPHPFAAVAPDITWHVAGLAKCIGAGLRAAFVVAPDARSSWPVLASVKTATVMASPLTSAVATRWIEDGTADAILRFIRTETSLRQNLARDLLPKGTFRSDPLSFNIWLTLPRPWTRASFITRMRPRPIGIVASDAFTVEGPPQEAVRLGLGGPLSTDELRDALEFAAHVLQHSPALDMGQF